MDKVVVRTHAGTKYVWYHCPGCQQLHGVPAERWSWNGSVESPTLSPSVRHYTPKNETHEEKTHCHYFVQDGQIRYCGDCDHKLSGQTVAMIEPDNVPGDS